METLVIARNVLALSATGFSALVNSLSEANLMVLWGVVLLAAAHITRARWLLRVRDAQSRRAPADIAATSAIRLQPGL